ncbi:MAG: hypothetical protein ACTS22_09750 [Phycisphaerales bacterium]
MSALDPVPTLASPVAVAAATWPIARHAIEPWLREHTGRDPRPARGPVLLRIVCGPDACTAEIEDPALGTSTPIELGPVRRRITREPPYLHIDAIDRDGHRVATISIRTDDGTKLVYAATTLLAALGLRGGRYGRPTLDTEGTAEIAARF